MIEIMAAYTYGQLGRLPRPAASKVTIQPTGHLQRKSINGKRITLHHVRPDGKPHYIGPPGVMK